MSRPVIERKETVRNRKTYSILAFLFVFLAVILSINFFHTEVTITNKIDDCPACHFLRASCATNQVFFFRLPPLSVIGVPKSFCSRHYSHIIAIDLSSRSPPEF